MLFIAHQLGMKGGTAAVAPVTPDVSTGGGGGRRRRPGEKIIWHDDWVRAQEELTKAKAAPAEEREETVVEAVEALARAQSDLDVVNEAKEIIAEAGTEIAGLSERLAELDAIDAVLTAYFAMELDRQREFRREQDIGAMLVLGIL